MWERHTPTAKLYGRFAHTKHSNLNNGSVFKVDDKVFLRKDLNGFSDLKSDILASLKIRQGSYRKLQ